MELDVAKINIIYTDEKLGEKLRVDFANDKNIVLSKSFIEESDFDRARKKKDKDFIEKMLRPVSERGKGLIDKEQFSLSIIAVDIDFEEVKSAFLKAYLNLDSDRNDVKAVLFRSIWAEHEERPEVVYIFPGGLNNDLLVKAFHRMKDIDRLFNDFVKGSKLNNKLFKFIYTDELGWTLEAQQSVKHQIQF